MNYTGSLNRTDIIKTYLLFILPVLITIAVYSPYINMPFDYYDNWLQNIAFGGFNYDSLPQNLKNNDIPTSLKTYFDFSATRFGRIAGYAFTQNFLVFLFDRHVILWRCFSILTIIFTLFIVKNIVLLLKVNINHCLFFLCINPFFLSYNFIFIISPIISMTNLFLLIAINLELKNSNKQSYFKIRYSLIGALFVLLTLFYHEISFTYGIVIFLIIFFWNNNSDINIKEFNIIRLIPYAISLIIFLIAFVYVFYFLKDKSAYAGFTDNSFINIAKHFVQKFLLFFGFSISSYLGLVLFIISSGVTFYIIVFKKRYPQTIHYFKLAFSLTIILSTSFITSIISQGTNESWLIQMLAVFVFYSTLVEFVTDNATKSVVRFSYSTVILFVFIISVLQINKTYKELRLWKSNNISFNRLTDFLHDNLPKEGKVLFQDIPVSLCYSTVGDVFLKGRHDNIQYMWNGKHNGNNQYVNTLIRLFNQNIEFETPDFTIMFNNSEFPNPSNSNRKDLIIIISEPIKQTLIDKLFVDLNNFGNVNRCLKSIIFNVFLGSSQNSLFTNRSFCYYVYKN